MHELLRALLWLSLGHGILMCCRKALKTPKKWDFMWENSLKVGHEFNRFRKFLAWLVSFIRIYTKDPFFPFKVAWKWKSTLSVPSYHLINKKRESEWNVMKCAKEPLPDSSKRKPQARYEIFMPQNTHFWTFVLNSDMKYKPSFVIQHHFRLQETGRIISITRCEEEKRFSLMKYW